MLPTECSPYRFDLKEIENLKDVSIYVGGACNFNCRYCDRDFVKKTGVQKMAYDQDLADFLKAIYMTGASPMISFHGGETLLYIDTIKKIVKLMVDDNGFNARFYIQTNGSLILKNADFFRQYKDYLYVSISYDFHFQLENRTEFGIHETLQFLDELKIDKQLQYVIPTNRKEAFDVEVFSAIVNLYKRYRINSLNLILLRHQRAIDNFKTVIASDDIDLRKLFTSFLQFVQLLYVSGINVALDGHSQEIDKDYYSNHKQIVLAPDGFIYPEYQFIEYKHPEFRLGQWRSPFRLERNYFRPEGLAKMRRECKSCFKKDMCGLQYYYAMFDIDPPRPDKCVGFYSYMEFSLNHLFKLKRHRSLLESIGI